MELGDFFDDRQAQACRWFSVRGLCGKAFEGLKNLMLILVRKSGSIVMDINADLIRFVDFAADGNLCLGRRKLNRIAQEIIQGAL